MKRYVHHLVAFALGVCCQAQAAPVVLSKPDLATYILQVRQTDDGNLCIVGETMDPDGDAESRGLVILYSLAKNQVVWQQTVAAPDNWEGNRFVACRVFGKDVYVAANVDTHTEQSLNQGLAWIYRFSSDGKLLGKAELDAGARNTFVYDLDADGEGVTVVGRAAEEDEKKQTNAMFFARLDVSLKSASIRKLATGAFLSGATVLLNGSTAYLGGTFAPANAALDVLPDDYAVSKIVAGKYQFSVRPRRAKSENTVTSIGPASDIVSLGYVDRMTHLTAVGANGKIEEDRQFASVYCQTDSMSADSTTLYAVRLTCGKSHEPARLVAVNRKTGTDRVVGGISGEPRYVLALGDKLIVVSRRGNGSLLLQTVAKGQ